ncbi:alkaline phosphatase D family protein [Thiohalorhabdus sp. Cl-TMA]|uniref:Alkaline phosphatase D family protein n=1 Tax=Thiohalorhabdus methylotrophus TaxID=3242694 RepID=A0ABV4TQS8_9GAMM
MSEGPIGPILFARGADAESTAFSALLVLPEDSPAPPLHPEGGEAVPPEQIHHCVGVRAWRYDFRLPARRRATYALEGRSYEVATDLTGDLRIAYVSCNGKEDGDMDRPAAERNALWRILREEHDADPFQLMLHGGDQLYADEVMDAHPDLHAWHRSDQEEQERGRFTRDMADSAARFFLARYRDVYTAEDTAYLVARVPSMMMWDDHDIIDGWGSHPRWYHDNDVAQGVFRTARTFFRLFQQGEGPATLPAESDAENHPSLTCWWRFPGLGVIAPDLRSQRLPNRVMDEDGWGLFEQGLAELAGEPRVLVLSSVPGLGPRLSYVERFLHLIPGAQKYEDDLRDQWQSPAHRAEWCRFLEALEEQGKRPGHRLTLLSGEIHLATRGVLLTEPEPIHQLVSSGIAHPPPPTLYARALGALARLGEDPLPGRPIRMYPLPGRKGIYTNERNFLVLTRRNGKWTAYWETEGGGPTGPLAI